MTLKELQHRLKKFGAAGGLEEELWTILRERPDLVLKEQNKQLFVDSVDMDDRPLGYYSVNGENPGHNIGSPFTMQDTHDFKNKMSAFVSGKKVVITSFTPHLSDMENNPFFLSTKFFGLTEESLSRLRESLRQELRKRIQWKLLRR